MEEQINRQSHVNKIFPIALHACDMRFSSAGKFITEQIE